MNFLLKMLLLTKRKVDSLPNLPNTEFIKATIEPVIEVTKLTYTDSFGEERIETGIDDINITVTEI